MDSDQQQFSNLEARQSNVGVVSLTSSVVAALMVIGVFPLMSILDRTETEVPEPWQSIGALYMPLAAFLALVAIGTGIAGLFVKNRRKGFALAGLVIGGCSILIFVGIVVMVFAFMERSSS